MRHLLDRGPDRTVPVIGVRLHRHDDPAVVTPEPDHPVGGSLHGRQEPLRLLVQWVVDDHVDLEVHGSTVANIRSYRNRPRSGPDRPRRGSRPLRCSQRGQFLVTEDPRAGDEVSVRAGGEGESLRLPRPHVEDQLGVLPGLELAVVDIERAPGDAPSRTSWLPTVNSPSRKQMGRLPSQQPPDWKNMTGPPSALTVSMACTAAGVAVIRSTVCRAPSSSTSNPASDARPDPRPPGSLEESEGLVAVADEQVLGLRVVLEHHQVILPADARDLVAPERRSSRVQVIAVRPHPAGLDRPPHAIRQVAVAGPHAGSQSVERVVGDPQRIGLVLEGGHREHGAEDLLLEDPHVIGPLHHRRFEVVAVDQLAAERRTLTADQHLVRPPAPRCRRSR